MSDDFSLEWGRIEYLSELAEEYARVGRYRLATYRLHNAAVRVYALTEAQLEPEQAIQVTLANEKISDRIKNFSQKLEQNGCSQPASENRPYTVALFGLSANPPTGIGGHAGIVNWCANSLRVDSPNDARPEDSWEGLSVDEVWVLPVYRHAFSEKSTLLSFEHRVSMAKLCFENRGRSRAKVQVRELEKELFLRAQAEQNVTEIKSSQCRLGSVDLVRMVQSDFPQYQFVFVMGGDTYRDFREGKWKEGFLLQELLPVVVCARHGVASDMNPLLESLRLQNVSSTQVRTSSDLDYLSECLEPLVLEYIRKHKLYAFAH